MSDVIVDPRAPVAVKASFQRSEAFDVGIGRILMYSLPNMISIIAHRHGVAFRGTIPVVTGSGMEDLIKVFRRAVAHHEHLKRSWDEGEQSYLSEAQMDARMTPAVLAMSRLDVQGTEITGP